MADQTYVVNTQTDYDILRKSGVPDSQIAYSGSTPQGYTAPAGLGRYDGGGSAVYVGLAGQNAPRGATTLEGKDRYATASMVQSFVGSNPSQGAAGQDSSQQDPNGIRNAADFLVNQFNSYGLGSLANTIIDYVKQGYGPDTVNLLLQQTPEYKQRFAANDARRAAGLPVLSPAEYLATERQYRQVLQAYGLPPGFYDQPSDFTNWLSKDVSPSEIAQRAKLASDAVQNTDPAYRDTLKQYYGLDDGHLAAYFLDTSRAEPLLEKQMNAAAFGAAASRNGLSADQGSAEMYAGMGVSADQARQGFEQIGQMLPTAQKLATLDQTQFGLGDAEAAVFGNDGQQKKKLNTLASSERARFSGSAGTGVTSLGVSSAGQL